MNASEVASKQEDDFADVREFLRYWQGVEIRLLPDRLTVTARLYRRLRVYNDAANALLGIHHREDEPLAVRGVPVYSE